MSNNRDKDHRAETRVLIGAGGRGFLWTRTDVRSQKTRQIQRHLKRGGVELRRLRVWNTEDGGTGDGGVTMRDCGRKRVPGEKGGKRRNDEKAKNGKRKTKKTKKKASRRQNWNKKRRKEESGEV